MQILPKRNLLLAMLAMSLTGVIHAEVTQPQIVNPDNLKWVDAKDFPPGVKVAILSGDPSKKEHFVARIKFPANYIIPAHSHQINEADTVISGTYYLGMGEVADANKGTPLHAGSFVMIPANLKHYGWTKEETILEINADGPWGTYYETNG